MKLRLKKFTSIFLAVIMIFGVLTIAPFTVGALGTANDIVDVARGEVGVSGQPNKYTYWLGSINGSYSYAWCHAFVSWCANQAGAGDKVPKTASCATGVNWFKNRGQWKSRSSGYTPKAGDIIYFDYGSNGTYDHVGIVTNSSGGRVYTIEGNARNAVKVNGGYSNGYSLSSTDILGYGTPSYASAGNNPIGCVDSVTGGAGTVTVRGWAFDKDDISQSLQIHVYIGGPAGDSNAEGYPITADLGRGDVNSVYGCGNYHGFNATIPTSKTGIQTVYVYAINIGSGEHTLLSNNTINILEKQWYDNLSPINLGDQFYALIKNKKTGNLISESNSISEYANDVIGVPANGDKTQTWIFNRNNDGSYSIKNFESNMYLDVDAGNNMDNLNAQPNGTNIQTYYKYNNTGNQKFYIYKFFDSYYIKPVGMNRIVDMGISNGLVAVWDYGGDFDPQKFDIIRIDANNNLPADLEDEFFAVIKNISTKKVLTVSETISEYAYDVLGKEFIDSDTQIWKFTKESDGSYRIQNAANEWYLDVEAGSNLNDFSAQPNGTNIQTYYKYNGTSNQKFYIYNIFDSYYIKPAGTQKMVDMGLSNGSVAIWDYADDFAPQKFDIIKVKFTGDINDDGKVTIDDVTLLQKYIAENLELSESQKSIADVNGDGDVMIDDVTMIQKYLAGVITKLG